jgi:opacity protein-like surface antigen
MKNKFLSIVAAVAVLSSSSFAGIFLDVGYIMADSEGGAQSGVSFAYGAKFGETIKQTIGMEFGILSNAENNEAGNIGNIYYNIGYEVLKDTVLYGSVGYGFQSLGSTGTGSTRTEVMADGITYGGGLEYALTKHIFVDAGYRQYNLSCIYADYTLSVANVNLGYKF